MCNFIRRKFASFPTSSSLRTSRNYPLEAIEKHNHKKFGDVISTYKIVNADGYDDESPLTEFDVAVLSACISEQKVGKHDAEPWANQNKAILHSVTKLMQTIIDIDLSDANKALGYNGGKPQKIRATILPCEFVTTEINGQPVDDVIHFYCESPIMQIAEDRNQILRYDTALLDVPGQRNTPLVIVLKNYVMRRIAEIKLHHMTSTLTFDDIFKRARIFDASYDAKRTARDTVEKFFEHLKTNGVVQSFEFVKKYWIFASSVSRVKPHYDATFRTTPKTLRLCRLCKHSSS